MKNFQFLHIPFTKGGSRLATTLLFCIVSVSSLFAQDTVYYENFDSSPGAKPDGWTTELESGDSKWQFVNGGGTKSPEIPGSRKPPTAYTEPVNALYFFESLEGESVILITPPINLEFAIRPELRFMHVQREGNLGFGDAHDELRVYYKTHFDSAWTEVRKLAEYTDEVYDWTEQTIQLPEEAFVPELYLAFKATTNYGWGVGIDDVRVIETEVQQRYLDNITVVQDHSAIVAAGSNNNPLLRINLSVKGNAGTVTLNSLDISSLNTSDNDIPLDGIKLHYNYINTDFFGSTRYDSASFVSGQAEFTSLNLNLPTGYTTLWISCDIKGEAVHNNLVDVMLEAGGIDIDGSTFPGSDASPAGSRVIQEAIFIDDFATDKGWTLTGDFERNRPQGLGGQFLGHPDPLFASGDTMILGNDLTGLGTNPGDYEANVGKYVNLATSPEFDLTYYNDVKLNFLRWLNVANNDTASIEISLDGGTNWTEVWSNDNNVFTDAEWKFITEEMPEVERESQVSLRFNLGPTTPTDHFSGWNIENLAITGNYVDYDVAPVALLAPERGCGHSSAETVRIRVGNFGPGSTPSGIPVRYSFDGGENFTEDLISGSIAFGGYRDFDFSEAVDLSTPGEYHVIIETALALDEEPINNQFDTVLYVDPAYMLPYEQNFESDNDFWRVEGIGSSFEYGIPSGSVISTAASGTKAWVTNLDGDYNDGEDSYLVGPCFDFSGVDYPFFECKIIIHTEADTDGANLEYSLNNGETWSRLGNLGDGDMYHWNWYNSDNISSLGGEDGWTGSPEGWNTARFMLDTTLFRNQPNVKFRFHFSSDAAGRLEGIGIDDIRIYNAPADAGVVSIQYPVSGCAQDIGDHVEVTIRNFGLDTLMTGDTLQLGYDLESGATISESMVLTSDVPRGGTATYAFTTSLEVTSSGWKDIEAFTLLDEVDLYNDSVSNDTTMKSFEVVQTPYVYLPPAIYTVRPDTVVLDARTGEPGTSYLWQDGSTDSLYQVTEIMDGIYHVTASNAYCSFKDTTYLYRLIADMAVTEMVDPVSSCELGPAVRPTILVRNFGTDTLHAGDTIPVGFRVDSEPPIEEHVILGSEVYPDSSFRYTFATPADMNSPGGYSVKLFTARPFDNDLDNDTLLTGVEVFGYTPIDLGPDTVIRAMDYTIDAGPGYDSYLWQDSSTSQTLVIDTTGVYSVTVRQGTMCENSDSILVTFLIPDVGLETLTHPIPACGLSATEHLELYVSNTGNDTLYTGDTLVLSYQMNGGSTYVDTLIVNRTMEPLDSILFVSSAAFDMTVPDTYQVSVEVFHREDLVPENNLLVMDVEVFEGPVVSLGPDRVVNAISDTLDAGDGYFSYLWQDGSSVQQFIAEYENQPADSVYAVTVVDANGCEGSDQVKIGFDLYDLTVLSLLSPEPACLLTDREEIRALVKNVGTRSIVLSQIEVVARVDDRVPVTTQIGSVQVIAPGDTVEFDCGSLYDFSGEGDHLVTLVTIFQQDANPQNDTMVWTIAHHGIPLPDLGGTNDSLETGLPHTLDAGADFFTYLWNGMPGDRTHQAMDFGWYILEVTNSFGCSGGDSIYLMQSTGIDGMMLTGELKIYPVPASQFLHIEYSGEKAEDLYLSLFDSNGRTILQRKYNHKKEIIETLELSGLARGVYHLRLHSGERHLIRRIAIH
jgi:hypothetical protein